MERNLALENLDDPEASRLERIPKSMKQLLEKMRVKTNI